MGLYEQIRDVAKTKGYSVNQLEKELGFARSSINKFNKNTPSADKIQKIADLLRVTTDTLLTNRDEPKKESTLTARDKKDLAKDLDKMINDIRNDKDGPLYYNGEEIDDESLDFLANAFEAALIQMKKINKEKYNPNKNKKK